MRTRTWLLCSLLSGVLPLLAQEPETASMQLSIASQGRYYFSGADSTVFFEVAIQPPESEARSRRNIALVIDRSGSMTGPFIRGARETVLTVLETLSPSDVVALVIYGSEVETLLEAQPIGDWRRHTRLVSQIEPAGGTALYDAINQAAAQVRRHAGPSSFDHILVICDGAPNKGPRETGDFTPLAELFAREGITLSTIGLGEDFDEDLLASLAQLGGGRFHYAPDADALRPAAVADLESFQEIVARDVLLTVEFSDHFAELEALGWRRGDVRDGSVTWSFPRLAGGQVLRLTASGELPGRRTLAAIAEPARARLEWTTPDGKRLQQTETSRTIHFSASPRVVQQARNEEVYRSVASQLFAKAFQEAIEKLDEGEHASARRTLQRVRREVVFLNFQINDPVLAEQIAELDEYLDELRRRDLNRLDRKILRSGIFNRFPPPMAADDEEEGSDARSND